MRLALIALVCLPLPVLAEVFTLASRASEAVIYPRGGLVTHEVRITADAGVHQVILPDLPPDLDLGQLRVSGDGLVIGALRYRTDFVPPRDGTTSEAITAAQARIDAIEADIQALKDQAARLLLAKQGADARVAFLTGLGDSDALPSDAETLAQIGTMVSTEVLAARQAAFDVELAARGVMDGLDPLREDLADAQAALAALVPPTGTRPLLSVDLSAQQAVEGAALRVSFFSTQLGWQPTYSLRLSDGDNPGIQVDRGAEVLQATGENWEGIALRLSTQRPGDQIDPSFLPQDLRRLFDPENDIVTLRSRAESTLSMADAAAPQAMAAEMKAAPATQGLSVVYEFAQPVNVASGADAVRIPFDTLEFNAELSARAVPLRDDTAYLVARFTNDTDEPLLPANSAQRFFDGGLVGVSPMPMVAAGGEVELGFGPIEGLQLRRIVLDRAEGDRGIIARSNEQTEEVRIEIENLTSRPWQVEVLDRVPYSEQEDLEITYTARPEPALRGVEDRRGILQWVLDMPPGASETISTSFRMRWPEGQMVR